MKKTDKQNLKNQGIKELKNLLNTARTDVFALSMDLKRNKIKNTSSLLSKRKEIARILTIIREKELTEQVMKEGEQKT